MGDGEPGRLPRAVREEFQDGRRLDGVLFVDPFAAANRKLVDLALPELPRR